MNQSDQWLMSIIPSRQMYADEQTEKRIKALGLEVSDKKIVFMFSL